MVGDVKANPKDFIGTSIVRKKEAKGILPFGKNGISVAQSESEKAAEVNGQFADVFTKSEHNQVPGVTAHLLATTVDSYCIQKVCHCIN